eukprot:scaffold8.g1386.t1
MSALAALEGLPSRGTLVSIQPGAVFSAPPAPYIADHDTAPPVHQVVRSDPTSLLIRTLHTKKAKEEAKRKQAKAADKGKRPADDGEGGRSAKRPAHDAAGPSGGGAGPSGAGPGTAAGLPPPTQTHYTKLGLQSKTIKELQAILKSWNLAVSGKKDDLIARIFDHQNQHR